MTFTLDTMPAEETTPVVAEKYETYVSVNAPALAITLAGHPYKFENKQLLLSVDADADAIVEFDKLIATKPAISQLVRKVDKEAAAKIAMAHRAAMLKRDAAVVGGMTAGHVATLNNQQRLDARDVEFAKQGVDVNAMQSQSDEIRKDDLMFTETAKQQVISPSPAIQVSV